MDVSRALATRYASSRKKPYQGLIVHGEWGQMAVFRNLVVQLV